MNNLTAGLIIGIVVALGVGLEAGYRIGSNTQYQKDKFATIRACDIVAQAYTTPGVYRVAPSEAHRSN